MCGLRLLAKVVLAASVHRKVPREIHTRSVRWRRRHGLKRAGGGLMHTSCGLSIWGRRVHQDCSVYVVTKASSENGENGENGENRHASRFLTRSGTNREQPLLGNKSGRPFPFLLTTSPQKTYIVVTHDLQPPGAFSHPRIKGHFNGCYISSE